MYKSCNYTMSAFYKSISLDQIIHVDKINELTPEQTLSNLLIKKLGKSTYESIQQKAHMLTISELMEQS